MADDGQVQFYVNGKQRQIHQLKARHIYQCFIAGQKPTAEQRWEREGYKFNKWSDVYQLPYTCTTSTRLQSLHFRVVHRYVPTSKFLHVRNVVPSPLCPTCGVNESLKHFLFQCRDVNTIWSNMLTKLQQLYNLKNDFVTCKTALFGYPKAKPIVNLLILLVKQYILSCKLRETRLKLSLDGVKNIIMHHFKTEKYISKYSHRTEQFQAKWKSVLAGDGSLSLGAVL